MAMAAGAARAAPPTVQPLAHPSRDVDVTYRLGVGRRDATERMRWLASAQRQCLDPPNQGLFMVIDYRAGRMQPVRLPDRLVLDTPAPPPSPGVYARVGEDRVAGLACAEWEATATDGRRTLACITEDGVMLRAEAGGRLLVEATAVNYAPQDPALFAPPPGFAVRRAEDGQGDGK
jgi:hypothetical protein